MWLDKIRNLRYWKWPGIIFLFVMFLLYTRYVPYARKMRGEAEKRVAQDVIDDRRAPLLRTEAMWREYAERAKVRGDMDRADKYNKLADEVRNTYSD